MQKLRLFGMNGVFALMLVCTAGIARGQQAGYLILIDAENRQPFTARIGDNLMPSSLHGHLIIPELQDSSYRICIRFPREATPEQVFAVQVNKKDCGFLLQGADSSWVLYNWQSKETIQGTKETDSSRLLNQGVKREDGFSRLMAAVVNDSSVLYNTYAETRFSKDSEVIKAVPRDSAALAAVAVKKPVADSLKLKKRLVKTVPAKPEIKKLREVSLRVSRKMVFLDASPEGEKDTITLFVYFEEPGEVAKKRSEDPMITARRLLKNDSAEIRPGGNSKEKEPVPANGLAKAGGRDSVVKKPHEDPMITARRLLRGDSAVGKQAVKSQSGKAMPGDETAKAGPSCVQEATDADAEALRSAILTANSLQDKISVATGAFAMKCFSVSQLGRLVELFVSDKAKFKFLDDAHGHVSDAMHFEELADRVTDKNYQKKIRLLAQKKG